MAAGTLKATPSTVHLRDHHDLRHEWPARINAEATAGLSGSPSHHGDHQAQIRHQRGQ